MRVTRGLLRVIASSALWVSVAACSGERIEPLALSELQPGVIELTTTCADGLHADTEETTDQVRIDRFEGDAIDGDCVGLLRIELNAPIGDREVVVDGERWADLPATCPWGSIGPTDLGERQSCQRP